MKFMGRIRSYLSVIFAIFRRDMQRLAKNPIALIIVAGLCILPSLYSWYTIAAFWDPYQNTNAITIAVANDDEGTTTQLTGPLNVGAEVVDSLKENHSLDWRFMDEEAAVNSVYAGESYAAIVIPKDFSASFASVFEGEFKRPQIEYYVNEKLTGSGVKIVDTGASDVEKQIDEQFVRTVSSKVLKLTQQAGLEAESAESAAGSKLATGVQEAQGAITDTISLLDGLPAEADAATASLEDATDAIGTAEDAIPQVEADLQQASAQIAEARTSLGSAASEMGTKATAASTAVAEAATNASMTAGSLAGRLREAAADAQAALAQTQRVDALSAEAIRKLEPEAQANPDLARALQSIQSGAATLSSAMQTLSQAASSLSATADALASTTNDISAAATQASDQISALARNAQSTTVPQMQGSLDAATEALGDLRGMCASVRTALQETADASHALQDSLSSSASSVEGAKAVLDSIDATLTQIITDLGAVHTSTALAQMESYLTLDPNETSQFLSSPVKVRTEAIYPVANYGSGVAPFFTNLALWVAGFILMAMVRIKVDPEGLPKMTERQAYFGRWLTYMAFGSAQGLITGTGDLVLGVQCVAPAAYLGTCWLTAVVYVNLMFGLAYALRHIGKAISVVLLIIQIPGSSGMFPIQMLPSFYQALNPLLPFTYSIDALREAIGGFYGTTYLDCMLMLALIYLPIGFLVGLGLGRWCHNLNIMFDGKLAETDLYITEKTPDEKVRFRMRTMVAALMDNAAFHTKVRARATRFQELYPRLRLIGWVLMFAVPVIMLVAMIVLRGTVDAKLALVIAFFCACVIIAGALIALDYADYDLRAQLSMADANKASSEGASEGEAS